MKILGQSSEGYMVKMSANELSTLTGLAWEQFRLDGYNTGAHEGKEFDIRKAWEQLNDMRANEKRVVQFANDLRSLAGSVEEIIRVLPELREPADDKDSNR